VSRPLVYASRKAAEQAATLIGGGVLENEVSDAILAGRVQFARGHGTVDGGEWTATVCRVRVPLVTSRRIRTRTTRAYNAGRSA
jgi:hypothetical protein